MGGSLGSKFSPRAPQPGQTKPVHQFRKSLIEISYQPVKWRDNRAKLDKFLFILDILYQSLHMILGSGDSDETG